MDVLPSPRKNYKSWLFLCVYVPNDKVGARIFEYFLPWASTIGVTNSIGQFTYSVTEPDLSFIPVDNNGLRRDFPSVILEQSWASTRPELVHDCCVWHEGSGGRVRIVILDKAYKPKPDAENQVRATLEISHARPGVAFTVAKMVSYIFSFLLLDYL